MISAIELIHAYDKRFKQIGTNIEYKIFEDNNVLIIIPKKIGRRIMGGVLLKQKKRLNKWLNSAFNEVKSEMI